MCRKNSSPIAKISIFLSFLMLCTSLLYGQTPINKVEVRFTNSGKTVESATFQLTNPFSIGSQSKLSFFCAPTALPRGASVPSQVTWVPIPASMFSVGTANRTQQLTLQLDKHKGLVESLGLKPGDEILTKVVFPEGYQLINRRALEAEGRYNRDKPNEVIIAIKIPGAALTVDEEGQMSMTASSYFLGTILSLILLRLLSRNWKHRAKWIAKKPGKKEYLQVKDLIRKGKLSSGLERLSGILSFFDYELQKEIELLIFQFSAIVKERELGRLSLENFAVEQNRITGAALSLLKEIE